MHRNAAALTLLLLSACRAAPPEAAAVPGEPLPGLSADELARFTAGRALFDRDFTEAEGLGPLFNQRRCSSCHDIPTLGGNGTESVTRATAFTPPDRCDLLEAEGGDLLQTQTTAALLALGVRGESVPAGATAVSSIHAPPLYGLGLLQAIPDDAILRNHDPDDADGDGISGRAVRLADGRLARFGRKLAFATVRDFIEDAIRGELGLTTPARPDELSLNGQPLPDGTDPAPDPEVDDALIDQLADYVRMLAAPLREAPASAAARDSIEAGSELFLLAGCASCHTPVLETAAQSDVGALAARSVYLYSDLLLHDMGDALASICGRAAGPGEWRTAPLFGLRFRTALLYDGRTQAFRRAIELHGGEAAASRLRFERLSVADQERLLRFLASL